MSQYDPRQVYFTYAGTRIQGYADGDFFSSKFNEDSQSLIIGADGDGCFIANANESGEVTVTLLASSKSNDLLSALFETQRVVPVPKPLYGKDGLGTSIISGEQAFIKKLPDITYGKEMSTREWVFIVLKLKAFVGGSL